MQEKDRINYINQFGVDDFNTGVASLNGYPEFSAAVAKFFKANSTVSPRDLHYIAVTEINDIHLDVLLGID